MSNYSDLMAQAGKLREQANEVRKADLAGIVDGIKATMASNGLTAEDLGFIAPKVKRQKKVKAEASAQS